MRWLRVALCVLGLALATGCGADDESGSADLPDALGYLPADATVVALIPTDLESQQIQRLHTLLQPTLEEIEAGGTLRESLSALFDDERVEFRRDIEPLLGGTLAASLGNADEDTPLFALETTDAEKAVEVLRRYGAVAAADGDTVLFGDAVDENSGLLDEAIARHEDGEGFGAETFARALGDHADDDAVLRLFLSQDTVTSFLPETDLPWPRALRSGGASLRLESDAIVADMLIRTDPEGLTEDDLPLETGDEAPEVPDVDGALNGANRNQSRTTVFLAQLARKAYPDSRFVREVEKLEAELGISFEDEVLRQFDGPSASIAYEDGSFGAVSDIADPAGMRELLPRLAPRLPPILQGLEALGNEGLLALLLIAPDAPLVPGAIPLLQGGVKVQRLEGDLYVMRSEVFEGPGTIVFGLIGDRFVVATDLERARKAAGLEVSEVDGAEGAAVGRTDFSVWGSKRIESALGLPIARLGEATGELEASTEGLEGRLRIAVPDGLD